MMLTPAVALKLMMTVGELHAFCVLMVLVTWLVLTRDGQGTVILTLCILVVSMTKGLPFRVRVRVPCYTLARMGIMSVIVVVRTLVSVTLLSVRNECSVVLSLLEALRWLAPSC